MKMKLKDINQSKKAKEEFRSPYVEVLRSDEPISKWDIAEKFQVSERVVREKISEVSAYYPVIATSNREGYRLAKKIDSLSSKEEMEQELSEVEHQINELKSRVACLKKKMKPLIAYQKVLEKRKSSLTPEENEDEK